jgi:hypothetical protein
MSSIDRRKRFAPLSLVAGPSAGEPICPDGHAKPESSIPDGWFRDEVGYVGDTEAGAQAYAYLSRRPA